LTVPQKVATFQDFVKTEGENVASINPDTTIGELEVLHKRLRDAEKAWRAAYAEDRRELLRLLKITGHLTAPQIKRATPLIRKPRKPRSAKAATKKQS
jgi:hypothetical protein